MLQSSQQLLILIVFTTRCLFSRSTMPASDEKHDSSVEHVEHRRTPSDLSKPQDDELLAPNVRVAAERRLVRTLDMRLLPTIIVIFIMNYIDVSAVLRSHALSPC